MNFNLTFLIQYKDHFKRKVFLNCFIKWLYF